MSTTDAATTPTGQAIERTTMTPAALVKDYGDSFAAVLPSHISKPDTWIRLAQAALKKGKRLPSGQYELEVAAANNIPGFLSTLLDCARLGLEPGTEQFYLTPREVKGRLEILGIVGYQGYVELMYRAGAVSSVVAECVFEHDKFTYSPGRNERPIHEIDWDAPDRGQLRLVYAYAVMKDGATSKVVVLNAESIQRIKAKAKGADTKYSPWVTDEPSMWLKSAVRQLRKWVPTSSEYIREQLRIARDVAEEGAPPEMRDLPITSDPEPHLDEDEPVDAELVDGETSYAPGEEPFDDDGFG